jgi:hypothetical protein
VNLASWAPVSELAGSTVFRRMKRLKDVIKIRRLRFLVFKGSHQPDFLVAGEHAAF